MESLLIYLAVGFVISAITGMIRSESTAEFLMRLVFIEGLQIIWWAIFSR